MRDQTTSKSGSGNRVQELAWKALAGWKSPTPILTISDVGLLPQDWRPCAARIKAWNGTLLAGTFEIRNHFGHRLAQRFLAAIPHGISVPTGPLVNGVTPIRELAAAALVLFATSFTAEATNLGPVA